jgi:osmotically-inducible protein OsmY
VQVAGRVAGVKTLYDEVEWRRPARPGTARGCLDHRAAALGNDARPGCSLGNYTIDTSNGAVYLIGSARTQAELELATRIARYIPGSNGSSPMSSCVRARR